MSTNTATPFINITNETIRKLTEHINENFNAFDDGGDLNLDKCQRNVAYSIGNVYTNYNGLLMQERHRLAEMDEGLKLARAKAYDHIRRNKPGYDVDSNGMKLLLDGHELVREAQMMYEKQEAYVKFLDNTVKQIGYYATGVKALLIREELRLKYEL